MAAPPDHVPESQLRDSFVRHAARAQLYRYLDYASRPGAARAVLLDILDDGVKVAEFTVAQATMLGDLGEAQVELRADGTVDAVADTLRATLRRQNAFLPRLTAATFPPRSGACRSVDHRARSVVHYFIALVENPARDPEPFLELLADRFSLHYTAEPLTDRDAVRAWVTGRLASVVASEHVIRRIAVTPTDDGRLVAEVTMKSQALFPDGSGAISRNSQRWTMIDDPARDRFPRITEILIDRDAVDFFGPAPDYAPRPLPG